MLLTLVTVLESGHCNWFVFPVQEICLEFPRESRRSCLPKTRCSLSDGDSMKSSILTQYRGILPDPSGLSHGQLKVAHREVRRALPRVQ